MAQKRSPAAQAISRRLQQEVGRRLQEARQERGVAQEAFAKQMGLTRTSVSNLERGAQRVFLDQVYQAAHVLGVAVEVLLPPLETIFPVQGVHSAPDDPLPERAAADVARVLESLRGRGRPRAGQLRKQPTTSTAASPAPSAATMPGTDSRTTQSPSTALARSRPREDAEGRVASSTRRPKRPAPDGQAASAPRAGRIAQTSRGDA